MERLEWVLLLLLLAFGLLLPVVLYWVGNRVNGTSTAPMRKSAAGGASSGTIESRCELRGSLERERIELRGSLERERVDVVLHTAAFYGSVSLDSSPERAFSGAEAAGGSSSSDSGGSGGSSGE